MVFRSSVGENELRTLDVEDALDFYKRFYTPNNAILVVAGDVTVDEVKTLTADTWANVPRRFETEKRIRQALPVFNGERVVTYRNPRVKQASVRRAWVVPSNQTDTNSEADALDVLATILGSGSDQPYIQIPGYRAKTCNLCRILLWRRFPRRQPVSHLWRSCRRAKKRRSPGGYQR